MTATVLTIGGLLLSAWSLPAAHSLAGWKGAAAALLFPVGITLFLAGTLLLAVPGFLGE